MIKAFTNKFHCLLVEWDNYALIGFRGGDIKRVSSTFLERLRPGLNAPVLIPLPKEKKTISLYGFEFVVNENVPEGLVCAFNAYYDPVSEITIKVSYNRKTNEWYLMEIAGGVYAMKVPPRVLRELAKSEGVV